MERNYKISEAHAVYTGGNIWLFYGTLTDGHWFLTDDWGATLVLNADPSDFDESTYEEWQQEHLVEELMGERRKSFCNDLCDFLLELGDAELCCMGSDEIEGYRDTFMLLI